LCRRVPARQPSCFLLDWNHNPHMVILRKPVAGLSEDSLRRFLARASRVSGLSGAMNVLVTTSRELQSLNRRFRRKDKPTDVLSFPPLANLPGGFAGDVAISADIAARNGKRLGHSAAQEVKILLLHGILHLAGYDHERDNGTMARKEELLRKALRLPVGMIARGARATSARRGPVR
jgi:probable rRNA maturation factor